MIKTCKVCGGLEHGQRTYMCKCGHRKDERNRYREALERIAGYGYPVDPETGKHMAQIAAEVLGYYWQRELTDDERKAVQEHIYRNLSAEPYSMDP